jgi:protein O-mannosyl-transferase
VRAQLALRIAICAGLIAITWAVFGQTLGHDFVNFDDPPYVSENPQIQAGLNWQNVVWAFTHVHSHNWHPLTTMSHMLDCQLFGLKPGAHHFVNVLLHSASVVLLFLLLQQMTASSATASTAVRDRRYNIWASAFVAAIFAIHPLHVESVAWIAERKDMLSGLFFMLTLLAYFHYTQKPSVWRYVTMSILFGCGLLAKPMLVTLPVILLLLDYWPLERFQRTQDGGPRTGKLLVEKIPLFVLSIGSAVATLIAQRGGIVEVTQLPLSWRVANASSAYLIYVWQTIWPANLALVYPHPGRLPLWETASASGLLILITAGVFILRRRSPYLMTGWLWYLILLVPVIGLVQVGSQAHADRYAYLPQIGLCIMIAWAVADLLKTSNAEHRTPNIEWTVPSSALGVGRWAFGVLAAGIIGALAWRAWIQTSYWHDTERLWSRTFAITKQNDVAHFNMGEFLLTAHRLDEAIAQFAIVAASRPQDPDVNFQLGSAFMEKGELARARRHFEITLKAEPGNPEAETNLANVLLQSGQIDEAVAHYRNVVQRQPRGALAHYNLAVGLHRQGRLSEAIAHYKEALAIQPGYPDAEEFLRQALQERGQSDEH